jgi:predicted dienelactone hydrolase
MMLRFFVALSLGVFLSTAAHAATLPIMTITTPDHYQTTHQKYPLILFSHGFMGCPKQSSFLTKALADHGYIVVAPRHKDATCGDGDKTKFLASLPSIVFPNHPDVSFDYPQNWSDKTEQSRRDDMEAALAYALRDPELAPYIDQNKIGLMGHSLGGYTVLGLAGAWPSWKDKRFKAVLAMAPYLTPYTSHDGLKNITIPVMYQVGSKDDLTRPWHILGGYYMTQGRKFYEEFGGAGHFDWTDLKSAYHQAIIDHAVTFFDANLKK